MAMILLTAFEPFGGLTRNPSAEALSMVAATAGGQTVGLVTAVLPVEFAAAGDRVEHLLAGVRPAAWVGLGLDWNATTIKLERQAVNLDDAALPDNGGDVRRAVPIDPAGPHAWPATLPLAGVMAALTGLGLPTAYSDSAGRFVCNHTFYRAAAAAGRSSRPPLVGFVHVPWPADWPDRAVTHGITFADVVTAVSTVADAVRAAV